MSTAPFVERHRPEDLESIVLPKEIKDRFQAFAVTGDFPQSCVLHGEPGLGKSTTALAVVKDYFVRRGIYSPDTTLEQIRANSPKLLRDVFAPSLFVASRTQGNIDFVKGPLTRFLQGAPPSPGIIKFVIMDEADGASKDALEALLPLIERYSTSRFIFTTNTEPVFGLGPAIVSRAGGCLYEFTKPSKEEVITHLKKIAEKEGVALSEDAFTSIADVAKDVREAVGMLGSDIALVRAKEAPKIVPLVPEKPTPQLAPVLRNDLQNFLKSLEEFRGKFFTRLRPENRRAGFLDLDNEFEMLFFRWRDSFAGRMKNLEFHRANEPENIRFLGYDLITEEFKTVRANFLRDPQRGLERLDTAIDYLREIIEGKWMPVPSKLEEALLAREKEAKPPEKPKKFPPIPKEGITEEWIEEVLSIDPFVKLIVTRKRAGEYEIEFQKAIDGEPLTLAVQEKLTFALTRDTLLEGKMDSMRWNAKDVTIPAMWEEDEERFEKTYTREELENQIARGLTLMGLQDIARIKGLETKGKVDELVDRIAGLPAPKEAAPPTPIPSRTREEARPPPPPARRARITDTDAKTLEEAFRAEMALRGIPLKSSTTDYLAVFKAYLREAITKGVSPDRFKSNWLPNVVSSIEEVYSNRTTVATQEVTRRIVNADARFKRDDITDYNGQLKRVIDLRLNQETGTYEYQLEGVEGMVDESLLKPANIPRAKWNVGDNLIYANKGYLVQDRSFNSETRKWVYRLKLITVRTGEMA